MTDIDCAAFGAVAAELALGILTGLDRSAALDHLDRCTCCLDEAASLAIAADRLLDLIPPRGAPAGFEGRTVAAFRPSGPGQAARRRRTEPARPEFAVRRWRMAAAVAAVVATGLLSLCLHEIAITPGAPAYGDAAVATLRTPAGARVGEVVVTGAPRHWLVMIVNAGAAPGRYLCFYLRVYGGRQEFAGAFQVGRDGGAWVVQLPLADSHLIGARLVGPGGTEIASATLS